MTENTPDPAHFDPDDLPDLTGTRAVVTGANSGIGFHTAAALVAHGAEVVLACRNTEAAQEAAKKLPGEATVEQLDLASQASVREFAARFEGPLDLLVNNAGVMTPPRYRETEDGHELQFGTNHLGHFALTARLLPRLLEATDPRVVTVSSIAHRQGDQRVLEGNPETTYNASRYYGNAKLAHLLFAVELQRRAAQAGSPLVSTAAHPGVSNSNLVSSPDGLGSLPLVRRVAPLVLPLVLQSSKAGANPTLWAASYAEPGSYTGPTRLAESRGRIGEAKRSRYAQDEGLARDLWKRSEELTGVTISLD